ADRRFGVDNVPETTTRPREFRTWFTDLHTRRTQSAVGDSYCLGDCTIDSTAYPVEGANWPTNEECAAGSAIFHFFGGDIAGGGRFPAVHARFYAWAAVIEAGHVVATDYAPDTGWLQPSAKAPPSASDSGEMWGCPPAVGGTGGEP
ncbi:MAG TPA: hypothetical protein VFJ71_00820, partial [Candidatus Limnocylindrales bacterium]|nr:hypothetical protein [Candidatus Limnocylindrales bacterium]